MRRASDSQKLLLKLAWLRAGWARLPRWDPPLLKKERTLKPLRDGWAVGRKTEWQARGARQGGD